MTSRMRQRKQLAYAVCHARFPAEYYAEARQVFVKHLLGSHTYSVRPFYFGRRICRLLSVVCLSVPRQISKLSEIGANFVIFIGNRFAEQENDVRFFTKLA